MIINSIGKFKPTRRWLIRTSIKLHNLSLMLINSFVVADNHGIHPKHSLMKYHKFFTDHIQSDSVVLDIGCGIGIVAADVAKKAKRVVAVDLNPDSIAFAKKHYLAPNIDFRLADATREKFQEQFDYVILSNVLEHITDRAAFLNDIRQLAPTLLIRVPMINRDWLPLYQQSLGLFPYSDKDHRTEYTFESFQNELNQAHLRIVESTIQFGEIWSVVVSL
ncbi:MAG: class I SAM-dependent methyltransferase [Patescibacteria group bacterium]|jgi:2-polyprenyl-3-methyl-5-hydroxy-6-metoxy-1,4-benzoquinol methylase